MTATDPQNEAPVEALWAALRPMVAAGSCRRHLKTDPLAQCQLLSAFVQVKGERTRWR
jgi:hypothetical protein